MPLWDPGHNGGETLLGNPMCALFYPGKVLYALLPYAWAARFYVDRAHGSRLSRACWSWGGRLA